MDCSKCGKAGEFYPSLKTICKECHRIHLRGYYAANKEKFAERDRKRDEGKRQARKAVEMALRAGTMERQPCVECGADKAQAHHESYAPEHWLAVEWLCATHHKRRHAKAA